jgi:hypothetical protein
VFEREGACLRGFVFRGSPLADARTRAHSSSPLPPRKNKQTTHKNCTTQSHTQRTHTTQNATTSTTQSRTHNTQNATNNDATQLN